MVKKQFLAKGNGKLNNKILCFFLLYFYVINCTIIIYYNNFLPIMIIIRVK